MLLYCQVAEMRHTLTAAGMLCWVPSTAQLYLKFPVALQTSHVVRNNSLKRLGLGTVQLMHLLPNMLLQVQRAADLEHSRSQYNNYDADPQVEVLHARLSGLIGRRKQQKVLNILCCRP